jgi:hypothetical protein
MLCHVCAWDEAVQCVDINWIDNDESMRQHWENQATAEPASTRLPTPEIIPQTQLFDPTKPQTGIQSTSQQTTGREHMILMNVTAN